MLTFIEAKQLVKRNKKVIVATSGGPDSLALLHFFWQHRDELNLELIALTIDHGLRGAASREDVMYVQKVCEKWNIPCIAKEVDVISYKKEHHAGTQLAARNLRYEVFQEQMKEQHADYLALGHHADDQIETLLMALSRTTTLHNLVGIPLKRPFVVGEIIRPFLCVSKNEIENYVTHHKLEARIDQSNFTKEYTRNRLRASIVPQLKKENPNLITTVQKLSETLQEDDTFLMKEAQKAFNKAVHFEANQKTASLSTTILNRYPVSLQRRVFRLTLDYLYVTMPKQLSYTHEDIFLALLREEGNKRLHFPEQLIMERAYHTIYFYFQQQDAASSFEQEIAQLPDGINLPDGGRLSFTFVNKEKAMELKHDPYTYVCSRDKLQLPLIVRTRKPGDKMTYKGLTGTKKIKDIFIDEKIPRQARDKWYLLTDAGEEVLWLLGLIKNERFIQDQESYVCIRYRN